MARRSGQCPPRRGASGAAPPRAFGAASGSSAGQDTLSRPRQATSSALREFRYRSQSTTPCPGRWVRFLAGMALVQALFGLLLWLRTPSQVAINADVKAPPSNLTAFADPDANIDGIDANRLGDIAVLVMATGRNVAVLRECLQSLTRVSGLDPKSVLVAQDAPNDVTRKVVEREFSLSWVGPGTSDAQQSPKTVREAREAWQIHYKRSLDHAVWQHFYHGHHRAMLIVEEDLIFSPDMLWYFAQLELVLQLDRSLWCVSAWNDNGLAPYVADATVVMRTDWFSGVGWLVHLEVLRGRILVDWPNRMDNWRVWLRDYMRHAQRQCLFPEVPRLAFSTTTCAGLGRCGDEEAFERQLSMRSVMSSSPRVNVGDVTRLEMAKYWELISVSWPRQQTIAHAMLVASIEDLEAALEHISIEAREREMVLGEFTSRRPLLLRFALLEGSAWAGIAAYFGLATWAPRGTYHGVMRLRWRDFVLYLAANTSPLLANRDADLGAAQGVSATDLLRRAKNPASFPPAAVPPHSVLNQAPPGVSCSRYCDSMRHVCVDADLMAVDRCTQPLTSVFTCRACRPSSAARAYPGWDTHDDTCVTSSPSKDEPYKVPDCSAEDFGTRRLCVCRRQRGQTLIQLQSPGRRAFTPQADGLASVSPQRQRAFKAATRKDPRRFEMVDISRFASDEIDKLGFSPKPNSEIQPSALAVLVVALPTWRSEPRDLRLLNKTLTSLKAASGFDAERVLVAHDDGLLSTAQLIQEQFYLLRVEVLASRDFKDPAARAARLYRGALDYAVNSHFGRSRSIFVLEEGTVVAPDILWYMAQLEPLLMQDSSIFCVSALNDNGIAPYVADATVVMRTDFFSGVAWLARTSVLRKEFLPQWPSDHWERFVREPRSRHGRQCLIPEVSRAKPFGSVTPLGQGSRLKETYKHFWESMPLCNKPWVDLGDTKRLLNERYRNLFLNTWTGEGLLNAKPISSIRPLKDGRLNHGGPWRLVYQSDDPDHDISWQAIAGFFMIWAEVPIRGAYYGVLRLRWHNTVLFLVPSSSALARSTSGQDGPMLRNGYIADPKLFFALSRPLLLPANSEIVGASSVGASCDHVCHEWGLTCLSEDLFFINNCAALTGVFSCRACEPSEGSEQPAQVIKPSSGMHEKCLYNTDTYTRSPSCGAKHADTLRLCICRNVKRPAGDAVGNVQSSADIYKQVPSSGVPSAESKYIVAPATKVSTTRTSRSITSTAPPTPPPFAAKLATQPSQINILVIASGRRPKYLQMCLASLSALPGFHRDRVLVSQDGQGADSRRIAQQQFGVGWTQNKQEDMSESSFRAFGQRVTAHFKYAITYALTRHFPKIESLLVMEEDLIAAPDFLWYFAQLEPLLHEDPSLWCISAWNDNALAPYVADPAALLRTDIFSAVAWLLPADLYRTEILKRWPQNSWDKYLRSKTARSDRQCIIPEMPRVHHIGTFGEDVATSVSQTIDRDESMFWDPSPKLQAVDLGDISRLTKVVYNQIFSAELRGARLIDHVFQLPDPAADADRRGSIGQAPQNGRKGVNGSKVAPSWRLHYETSGPETDGSWKFIARFFHFRETAQPRGTYREILRIRWGPGVLFLVAQTSPLIWEADLDEVPSMPLRPYEFSEQAITRPPVLVPPGGVVVAAKSQGLTCSAVCSAEGRECVTADLVFINSCNALTRFHFCERCESNFGSDQPALVSQAGNEFYGRCLFNDDIHKYPPSCEAAHKDTRRLCICRPPLYSVMPIKVAFNNHTAVEAGGQMQLDVVRPGGFSEGASNVDNKLPPEESLHYRIPDAGALQDLMTTAPSDKVEPEVLTAESVGNATVALASLKTLASALNLEALGWQGGHQGEAYAGHGVAAFADLGAPAQSDVQPAVLPIVVIASSTKPDSLRATLTALQRAKGFNPENVLVVQDLLGAGDVTEVHRLATKEFGLDWISHNSAQLGDAARANSHYRFAIERALSKNFKGARSLIIISENEVVSPDILVFFAQLEPLLHKDRTLWCVSAWNDNGFAPYVADLTALLRTDWFAGVAFMLRADLFQPGGEVLRSWPQEEHWHEYLRLDTIRRGRECIMPEVSRARLLAPRSGIRDEHAAFDERALPIFWNDVRPDISLGEVQRMLAPAYQRLFLSTWPGLEGLALATEVGSLAELDRAQRGTLRMVVRNDMETWVAVSQFFRLGSEKPIGTYQGVLRLRWRGGVLHVVQQGSPLIQRTGLSSSRIFSAFDFESSQKPILRAPDVAVILSNPGQSCDDACSRSSGHRCHAADLLFVNSCAALRHYGGEQSCSNCLAGFGRDQPSLLAANASPTGVASGAAAAAPGRGTCFWNANLAEPPLCEAAHPLTARVCTCRFGAPLRSSPLPGERMENSSKSQGMPQALEPRNRIDASLSSHRCGALFGNRISADCAEAQLWCCSAGMWCGNSPAHCSSAGSRASVSDGPLCRRGSPVRFCGLGWSLRLPELGLSAIA